MPTYQCRNCGNVVTLSIKPGQCQICQSRQFSIARHSKKNSSSTSVLSSNRIKPSSLYSSSEQNPKTQISSVNQSSSSDQSLIAPSTLKYQKTYPQPSSPSRRSNSANFSFSKTFLPQFRLSQKILLHLLLNPIILIAFGLTGVFSYWLREQQFDTREFKKIVLQESFKSSKNWSLSDGSSVRKGSLFKRQPLRYHFGASIWNRKNLTDVDFSAEVTKTRGAENNPYGITARINGKSAENFYYLLIDAQGRYVLGKHTKDGWFPKVGWKKDSVIKTGNTKNQLRIVCQDDLIFGVINGKRVGSFRDNSFKSGKIAVFSMRDKGEATTVYFDNVLVKEK